MPREGGQGELLRQLPYGNIYGSRTKLKVPPGSTPLQSQCQHCFIYPYFSTQLSSSDPTQCSSVTLCWNDECKIQINKSNGWSKLYNDQRPGARKLCTGRVPKPGQQSGPIRFPTSPLLLTLPPASAATHPLVIRTCWPEGGIRGGTQEVGHWP